MADLALALQDARADVLQGDDPTEVFPAVAKLYDLNPLLLARKFVENYGDPLAFRDAELRRAKSREETQAQIKARQKRLREKTAQALVYRW